uniref:SHSP domain-containing protein n=1 Tax=viral metagenome TaxID=1070528 RepID=A0A6C0H7E9_9ZZZZ
MSSNNVNTQDNGDGFQKVQRRRRGQESDKVFQLQQQIKNLQRRYNSARTDLLKTDDTFIVRMELPATSFKWELKEDQILLVSQQKVQEEYEGAKEVYRECRYGQNIRRVKLLGKVKPEPISESYNNGVWVIRFARLNNLPENVPVFEQSHHEQPTLEIDFEKLTLGDISKSWADEM